MRLSLAKLTLVPALIAGLLVPSLAEARSYCEHRAHERRVTGTVIGAAGGALLGGVLGHGAAAPLLGAAGGAVVGNQLARRKCVSYSSRYRHHRYYHHS